MEYFKASTQYGDWEGTAAADAQPSSLQEYLEEKGLIKPDEFLVAASLYVGEHNSALVQAFVFQNARNFASVRDAIVAINGRVPVRRVNIKLTTEEFMLLFKRFRVVLTWHGLQLEGRDYVATES